ncbi:MAG: metallophosphoesterase [Pseudomonadota bacterium]|nr:metallophosphoesterase [Pseudomonadota bacterium]
MPLPLFRALPALTAALACCMLVPMVARAAPGTPVITLFAAGDIARCAGRDPAWSGAAATAKLIEAGLAADPHGAVLALGDLTYPRGAAAEFTDCYGPTWGAFRQRTYPVPGNHEYATPGAAGYFGYFGAVAAAGHYSVQLGAWRLYALDSNLGPAAHAAQLAWLREELRRHPTRCSLAYWHHPLYSSGMHGNNARMRDVWQVLVEAGAELVLSGHDHIYERFAPQDADGRRDDAHGMRQFVVGTGGAHQTPLAWPLPNSETGDSNVTGVLKLELGDDGYAWEFVEASNDGFGAHRPPDRGAARCH